MMYSMLSLFGIYSLRDIVELAGITLSIYLFLSWLRRDEKSPLVAYCIAIFTIIYTMHVLQLQVLTHFLLLCLPWFFLMIILFHQKMLQSNFIAYEKKSIQKINISSWLQVIIRALVRSMNGHQKLTLVIERSHSVSAYLKCEARMNAAINDDIIFLILEAHRNKKTLMMLLDENGYIKAVPVFWDTQDISNEQCDPIHDALLVTAHNDTLVITTDIHQRTFALIMKGAVTQQLSAAQLLSQLEQIFTTSSNWRNTHEVSSIISK